MEKEIKINLNQKQYNDMIKLKIWTNQSFYKNDYVTCENSKLRKSSKGAFNFKYRLNDKERLEFEGLSLDTIERKILKLKKYFIWKEFDKCRNKFKDTEMIIVTNRLSFKSESFLITLDNFSNNKKSLFEIEFELLDNKQHLFIENIKKELPKELFDIVDFNKIDNKDKFTKLGSSYESFN